MLKISLLLICFLVSCAYYTVERSDNPLAKYGIESIKVPLIVNNSIYPNLSAKFTKEFIKKMNRFASLKVYSGNFNQAQATLIGVLTSNKNYNKASQVLEEKITSGDQLDSLGSRKQFYIPYRKSHELFLYLWIVKNAQSDKPQMILHHVLPIKVSQTMVAFGGKGPEDGVVVNATHNLYNFDKVMEEAAVQAALDFETLVIYAF